MKSKFKDACGNCGKCGGCPEYKNCDFYESLMKGESLETQILLIKRYDAYNNKRK